MTPSDILESRISQFTLAIAKDSGWYSIDLGKAEAFTWGREKGCDMLNNTCSHATISEFCPNSGDLGCSDNHQYRTECKTSIFNVGCPVNLNVQNCKIPLSEASSYYPEDNSPAFRYGRESVCLSRTVGASLRLKSRKTISRRADATRSSAHRITSRTQ